ncbi:hypothetical protein F4782DRAFT_364170 [Xylaria castorea]|nr:hypothetical protein F4782DRAFT_364170 [Xylaria castorea]
MSTQQDVTVSLKRKASRWQMLPPPNGEAGKDIDVADGRYSLLLFLRDLDASANWNDFIEGLQNAPGVLDENSTMAATLAAALETRMIQYDYIDPAAPDAKKRRLDLYGNEAAANQIAEYDSLVTIARAVWSDPNDLRNYIGKAYRDNLRQLTEGDSQKYSLDSIFDYARSWSEVRYRFMNHALRDDPTLQTKYNTGRVSVKGNGANTIVHESNLLLDARMVEFQLLRNTGYNTQDRDIFQELYTLSPEEGRSLLKFTGNSSGLRIGLPQAFRYCVGYIDAYINWRVRVLESARKQVLNSPAHKNAPTFNHKQSVRNTANQGVLSNVGPADGEYEKFVGTLRKLIDEAQTLNAFHRTSFDELEAALGRVTSAVRGSVLNRSTDLRHNVKFQNEMVAFPNIQLTLTRPTGTSILAAPRRRPGT